MILNSLGNSGKTIAWIITILIFILQLYIIGVLQKKQAIIRLNYIEQEVIHKLDILDQRVKQDLEFLQLEIHENCKYKQLSAQDYMNRVRFVTYLQSLRYLRSISIADKNEVEELTRLNNNSFLKKKLLDKDQMLQFTPINVDENEIIVFDTESIRDSTLMSTKWFFETIGCGEDYRCSYLKEDSLTDLHYLSVSSAVDLPDNHYVGLKVDISLEGFYRFFGPTVKESSILMIDETGHVCCFCNDCEKCSSHKYCTFCSGLEKQYQAKSNIREQHMYSYYSNGNLNAWKVVQSTLWGKKHLFIIATHSPVKEVTLGLLPGTLLMFIICGGAIFFIYSNENDKSREVLLVARGKRGGRVGKKDNATQEPYSEKFKDKFRKDWKNLIKRKRHHEPGFNIGSFSIEYDYPRDLVNSLSLEVEGCNFGILLNKERINSAIEIIQSTDKQKLHIDQIAESVGFRSKASFYREFKQHTGKTPKEFIDSISG